MCVPAFRIPAAPSSAGAVSVSVETLDPRLPNFIKAKEQQARALARDLKLTVAPGVWKTFDLFERGDWAAAADQFNRLMLSNGQYEGSHNDKTVRTPVWQPLIEVYTGCQPFVLGEPKLARIFGDEIITSIPPGSIYFGGTDPGRGLVTALCKSQEDGDPFFTITQNAFADENYLIYLRRMYGTRIYIPSSEDSQHCFTSYLEDASQRLKENKLKPGEDVRVVEGRVQVSGQVAVMSVNALLAKMIFDKNPDRDFYLEESFPLDWMYPHLVPNGPILHVEREPVGQLSTNIVRQDQDYWRKSCGRFIGDWLTEKTTVNELRAFAEKVYREHDLTGFTGDPGFINDTNAQKAFSKLRSSLGGVYAWRIGATGSEAERTR
jgi:hypothetical protein